MAKKDQKPLAAFGKPMKTRKTTLTTFNIIYEDGSTETQTFSAKEYGAFKRTNKYNKILTKKKVCSITTIIKTW